MSLHEAGDVTRIPEPRGARRPGPREELARTAIDQLGTAAVKIAQRLDLLDSVQVDVQRLEDDFRTARAGLDAVMKGLKASVKVKPPVASRVHQTAREPRPGTMGRTIWETLPGSARDVADETGLPFDQVSKSLTNLRGNGYATSRRQADNVMLYERVEPPDPQA